MTNAFRKKPNIMSDSPIEIMKSADAVIASASTVPTTSMFASRANTICDSIFGLLSGTGDGSITDLLSNLLSIMDVGVMFDYMEIGDILDLFAQLWPRFVADVSLPVDLIEIRNRDVGRGNEKYHEERNVSILDILLQIVNNDDGIHSHNFPCKIDKTCKTCKMNGARDKKCKKCKFCPHHDYSTDCGDDTIIHTATCSYHLEKLSTHMVMAAIYSVFYRIKEMVVTGAGINIDSLYIAFFTGFVHDIGKVSSVRVSEKPEGIIISYAGHDILGSIMLRALYNPDMSISPEMYDKICRAVELHMCSYHVGVDEETTQNRMKILSHVSDPDLQDILMFLGYGDQLGKICSDEHAMTTSDFENDKYEVMKAMMVKAFGQDWFNPTNLKDIILCPMGDSGAGKTTLCRNLIKIFTEDVVKVVSRDATIADVITHRYVRFDGNLYELMYAIYNGLKEVYKMVKAIVGKTDTKKLANSLKQIVKKKGQIESAIAAFNQAMVNDPDHINVDINWFLSTTLADDPSAITVANDFCRTHSIDFIDIAAYVTQRYKDKIDFTLADAAQVDHPCLIVIDTLINALPNMNSRPFPNAVRSYIKIGVHIQNFCHNTGSHNGSIDTSGGADPVNSVCTIHSLEKPFQKKTSKNLGDIRAGPTMNQYLIGRLFHPDIVTSVVRTPGMSWDCPVSGFDSTISIIRTVLGM